MRCLSRLALLLTTAICLGAADAPPTDVVARRGDVQITLTELRDVLSRTDPAVRDQLLANPQALADFVRDRLLRQSLLNEAKAANWDQTPDVAARVAEARDTALAQLWLGSRAQPDAAYPNPTELAAAYEANKARFEIPTQFHLAQIAILVPANAPKDADEEARRKARELRAQVTKPKTEFAEIARKSSQDVNSAGRGGDLGWLREDQILPAVRDALRGLTEGGISEPVRSKDGWHVVKLMGTRPPSVMPLEQVKDNLTTALRQGRTQQALKTYLEDMLRKEPVQINEIGLAARLAPPK